VNLVGVCSLAQKLPHKISAREPFYKTIAVLIFSVLILIYINERSMGRASCVLR
jgi:hypothetical protein